MKITCNDDKCKAKWNSEIEIKFNGISAVRVPEDKFMECPVCKRTDVHWIYASDAMPEAVKQLPYRKQSKWIDEN